ncbi:MAG TPA: amidase [Vicinamibacterales bacterium]|jgi:Asp-tRNA(Asn)/Glu-tRNA(Gln) amidotransferase A subunit family amidase
MKDRAAKSHARRIGRRAFLGTVPAAVAAGMTVPALAQQTTKPSAPPAPALPPGAETPLHFGTDTLRSAERIFGVRFKESEEEMMVRGVNRNLDSYETLRKLSVPLDTEPAFTFRPYLPGRKPPAPGARAKSLKVSAPVVRVTSNIEDLAFQPVTALAPLVRDRQVSSSDLTRMYLARLKKHGETFKCVVTLTEELALAQAAQADKEIRAGRYRGPLHGIPWGAKDLFATKGIRTTWGAKPYENQVLDLDATVVERLREAGAVLVAKLSMGSLAQGGVWFGGSTKNPWNIERSSSGSSAGPASATAAGLVGFSIGTETLGSIMSPSSACGVTGLRPTYGRVSRYGAMALSWTMDKIGPICRTVEDCALAFNAIYGSDGRDDTVVDAPFAWNPDVPLSKLRVAYVRAEFEDLPANLSEERKKQAEAERAVLQQALVDLKRAGAQLTPIDLPDFPVSAIRFILSAEAAAAFDDLTRTRGIDQLTAQGPGDWPNSFRTHRFVTAVEYIRAQRARTLLMRRLDQLMSAHDAFVSATRSTSLTMTNLTGHPAITLKAGFVEKMPVGLMITGRLYDEATVLRVALAYERATKWVGMHPAV